MASFTHYQLDRLTIRTSWIVKLPTALEEHGFTVLVQEQPRLKPWLLHPFMEQLLVLAEELAATVMDKSAEPGKGNELRQLVQECHKEILNGSYYEEVLPMVIARKSE